MAKEEDIMFTLEKYMQNVCSKTASIISYELDKEAKYAIQEFYADYTPDYYVRHNETTGLHPYNFSERSHARYYQNSHYKKYTGGVKLGISLSNPGSPMANIYQDSTQEVFDTVYAGFHGVASMFINPKSFKKIPPRMQPSPMKIIEMKRDEIETNIDKYIDNAKKEIGEVIIGG